MLAPFDIFRCDSEGKMLWVSSSSDIESAKTKIRELMRESPCDYLVFSQKTQNKLRFKKGEEIPSSLRSPSRKSPPT